MENVFIHVYITFLVKNKKEENIISSNILKTGCKTCTKDISKERRDLQFNIFFQELLGIFKVKESC